jgi:hypothetical protein
LNFKLIALEHIKCSGAYHTDAQKAYLNGFHIALTKNHIIKTYRLSP